MKERYELKDYRKRCGRFYCGEIPEGHEVHHLVEAAGDLSKFVADDQRRFYETPMQRSVESGIGEIFLQNM